MAFSPRKLTSDNAHYAQAFQVLTDRSTELKRMDEFISRDFPNIISGIGQGKSSINVLGIGSGRGNLDIQMLSKIQAQWPGVPINNHVVEPNSEHISKYQELVAKTSSLGNIHNTWHNLKVEEYQREMEDKKEENKYDFIHMIQMLYYVTDVKKTVNYFRNCLAPGGKLLIILTSEKSGWETLWNKHSLYWVKDDAVSIITTANMKTILDEQRVNYEIYDLPSELDISECYVQGSRDGELLMDFLTHSIDYCKDAPSEHVVALLEVLKKQDLSYEKDGKIFFKNHLGVIVIPQ